MFVCTVTKESFPRGLDPAQSLVSLNQALLRVSVEFVLETTEMMLTECALESLVLPLLP